MKDFKVIEKLVDVYFKKHPIDENALDMSYPTDADRLEGYSCEEDNPFIMEILSDSHHGQFMLPVLLNTFGIDVSHDIVEEDGYYDWEVYIISKLSDEVQKLKSNCYVEMVDAGICVVYCSDLDETIKDISE